MKESRFIVYDRTNNIFSINWRETALNLETNLSKYLRNSYTYFKKRDDKLIRERLDTIINNIIVIYKQIKDIDNITDIFYIGLMSKDTDFFTLYKIDVIDVNKFNLYYYNDGKEFLAYENLTGEEVFDKIIDDLLKHYDNAYNKFITFIKNNKKRGKNKK